MVEEVKKDKVVREFGAKINIVTPQRAAVRIKLVGTAPLILDAFPDGARNNIRAAAERGKRVFSRPVHPILQFCGACYNRRNGTAGVYEVQTPYTSGRTGQPLPFTIELAAGVPTLAIKSGLITVVRDFASAQNWKVDVARICRAVRFVGEYAPLTFDKVEMIEVPTPTEKSGTVLKWMPKFWGWEAELIAVYFPQLIEPEDLFNLIQWEGELCGMGKMRPDASIGGSMGTYGLSPKTEAVTAEDIAATEILNTAASHGATLLTPDILKEMSVVVPKTKKELEAEKGGCSVQETTIAGEEGEDDLALQGDAGGEISEEERAVDGGGAAGAGEVGPKGAGRGRRSARKSK